MSLIDLYESTSESERNAGRLWYPDANRLAHNMAIAYGQPIETTAAVISALSPQTRWDTNTAGATKLFEALAHEKDVPSSASLYWKNVEKATAIARGDLPVWEAFRAFTKTWAFHHNILLDPDVVTLDTHMLKALELDRHRGLSRGEYRHCSDTVINAAKECGEIPYNFQAIVWLAVKDSKWKKNAV